jgi:hypothetical protein
MAHVQPAEIDPHRRMREQAHGPEREADQERLWPEAGAPRTPRGLA